MYSVRVIHHPCDSTLDNNVALPMIVLYTNIPSVQYLIQIYYTNSIHDKQYISSIPIHLSVNNDVLLILYKVMLI